MKLTWPWRAAVILIVGLTLIYFGWMMWAIAHRQTALDPYEMRRLRINGQSLFVEIPATSALQAKGLGGREALGADRGMMWVYQPAKNVTFWMKDMRFALDFIWIRDGHVIGVTANVPAPNSVTEELRLIHPPGDIDRVVEVNAGYAAQHRIVNGTTVTEFNN